ncbi:hypothetical protein R3W88_020115 [Solanum pinnatisectum]|uniref:Uncharacterized protein n=1 Tax=Solanum pinnatisectum TaxID=50273 RepID=A0AAV9KMP5_9SOLN|nr:hypothetical protein R3W88_020115 [Solanum pinnatisectum]
MCSCHAISVLVLFLNNLALFMSFIVIIMDINPFLSLLVSCDFEQIHRTPLPPSSSRLCILFFLFRERLLTGSGKCNNNWNEAKLRISKPKSGQYTCCIRLYTALYDDIQVKNVKNTGLGQCTGVREQEMRKKSRYTCSYTLIYSPYIPKTGLGKSPEISSEFGPK